MNIKNNLITISEYEEVPYDKIRDKISFAQIQKINEKFKVGIIKLFWNRIKATNYVGFIKLRNYSIQIIPKIFALNEKKNHHLLVQMLSYINAPKLKIRADEIGLLSTIKEDIFEFFIYLFAKNLKNLLKKEIKKRYVKKTENIQFVRGKILQREQIRHNLTKKWKFFCEYEEFTENNIINQILKYVSTILRNATLNFSIKRLLEDILTYFADVEFKHITLNDFKKIHFSRIDFQYKPSIDFCWVIISQSNIEFSSQKFNSFYFIFDMNRLYESFFSEFIKRSKEDLKVKNKFPLLNVKDQKVIGKLFGKFKMQCDLLVEYDNKGLNDYLLIDFKYKILDPNKTHSGISMADLYQMFAYSESQEIKYRSIILIYPESELQKIKIQPSYEHDRENSESIKIQIRSLNLQKIFENEKKINESYLKTRLNEILSLNQLK